MVDAYGRKITYLRLSVTDRCNLRCLYCMPQSGIEKIDHEAVLTLEEIDEIVAAFVDLGISKVRITGGEPLVRKGIVSLVEKISRHPGIEDLAMTTNGILLKDMAQALQNAGLKRVNISLDTLDEQKYKEMTRGGRLRDVLDGIEAALQAGLKPIKLNVVLIGGFNEDEVVDFVEMTRSRELDVRFIELMPIGEVARWSKDNFLSNDYVLGKVPQLERIEGGETGSPAVYYRLPGGKGRVGLISPISCKFCSQCNRLRLTAEGKLKYCLHSDEEVNLRSVAADKMLLKQRIIESVGSKPLEHTLEDGRHITRNMFQVGG